MQAFTQAYIVKCFVESMSSFSGSLQPVMATLCRIYALTGIIANLGEFMWVSLHYSFTVHFTKSILILKRANILYYKNVFCGLATLLAFQSSILIHLTSSFFSLILFLKNKTWKLSQKMVIKIILQTLNIKTLT